MPVEEHSDTYDPFEERLSFGLRETSAAFDTDRAALVTAGALRGRRRLLRRRAAVVGGAASLALVGVGGALLLPGAAGTPGRDGASVGAGRPSATGAPAPVSGRQLVRTLEKLLPEGKFSQAEGRGTDEATSPYAHLVFDDGRGPAAIGVSLGWIRPGSDEARGATQCPGKVYVQYDACGTTRLADGSVVMVLQGYEYPDRRVDTKWWTAELVTPEGKHVSVSEWNSASEKDSPISRPEPPLSAAQLRKLAAEGVWRDVIDAVPQDTGGPGGQPSPTVSVPAVPVAPTLKSLLPKGRKFTFSDDSGSATDFGYVVLDDGRGKSLVQVNVQSNMSDVRGELFDATSETLPDGTQVAVHQGPGEKGGAGVVMWTVDTMRRDGKRVVISAFNSGAQNTAATRTTPALTIAELRAIALSPRWWQ
ncbi:hypothetical protein ABZT17_12510 [Streptomyces sp. NPDC005648]|uniref:hypothetical protein n=1 Tax=Streptomyces sp. NPDC005648 TaxID=3157044 RepID=UPI0033B67459